MVYKRGFLTIFAIIEFLGKSKGCLPLENLVNPKTAKVACITHAICGETQLNVNVNGVTI